MARQLLSPFPSALLVSVVCWATLLFTCVGALSTFNALALIYEALGAASVASAIYLILEFSQPYLGLFRIPHQGIDQVIAALAANEPAAVEAAGRAPAAPAAIHFIAGASRRSSNRDCDARHGAARRG